MMTSQERPLRHGVFEFGDFTLDIPEHTLTRAKRVISLRPKAFDTLAYLVQRHGRLVTKDELLTALWTNVVVTEGALTHCIEEIRNALGDDTRRPEIIQTVPRVGYRFIAKIHEQPASESEEESIEEHEYSAVRVKYVHDDIRQHGQTAALCCSVQRFRWRGVVIAVPLLISALVAGLGLYRYLRQDRIAPVRTLAVLPLENISRNADDEYLADGLTDALISELAKIGKLRVISRTSVMYFKTSRKPLREINSELHADAVVEGTIFRYGDNIRMNVALVATAKEQRIWGDSYERNKRDMPGLIRDVARTVAGEINIELTSAEQARFSGPHSADSPAYELYLKGRYHWNKRTAEGFNKGIDCFERAIAADARYAPAFVGLADCYNMLGDYDIVPPRVSYLKGRTASLRALSLDSTLADAYASLAFSDMHFSWNWPEVESMYRRAFDLNPNCSNAHHWYALFLAMRGRFGEAREEIRKAQELDPLSQIIAANLAWVHYFARDYDLAVAACREVLRRDSNFVSAHIKLGWAYEQKALYDEALAEFGKARPAMDDQPAIYSMLARTYALRGDRSAAVKLIARAVDRSRGSYLSGYHLAAAYAALGEATEALHWLTRAYHERSGWMAWLHVDPKFDGLRGRAGFEALMDSLRLRELIR